MFFLLYLLSFTVGIMAGLFCARRSLVAVSNVASTDKIERRQHRIALRFASEIDDSRAFLVAYTAGDYQTIRRLWPDFWNHMCAQDALSMDWKA
ncbi:hypothetical protein [Agrobacterium vitis]|uniref:hypothetical protein n=1 Tax=Agrobacterium vitis TaxID=373 RepID=UPI000871ED83|nr:hypothetical protein [Agrobacterium vitis]MCM2453392.1 hypothetical protein [Agrobacterium vitis]MCM2470927.1 hypothetical protein [Agrobacterium vitis]MUO70081.1 hypothetical protein [Agrobacterium vitis]